VVGLCVKKKVGACHLSFGEVRARCAVYCQDGGRGLGIHFLLRLRFGGLDSSLWPPASAGSVKQIFLG